MWGYDINTKSEITFINYNLGLTIFNQILVNRTKSNSNFTSNYQIHYFGGRKI